MDSTPSLDDYRVRLDVYHGPLDLLLYLIKREEVDVHDIPIARITDQYLEHVRALRRLDVEVAGEFLVMAATLLEVKSAMLQPAEQDESSEEETGGEEQTADPRYELVQQLLAYKKYKDAAMELEQRREHFAARYPRTPAPFAQETPEPRLDLEDAQVWDLLEAFNRLMEQTSGGGARVHEVVDDQTPIELHAADIADRLKRDGPMTLQALGRGRNRGELVGLFLAMLELIRQRRLHVHQDEPGELIHLTLREESGHAEPEPPVDDAGSDAAPDPRDADQFEWPDERTRQRYVRRQQRRERGEKIKEDEELDEDLRAIENEQTGDAERE